LVIGCYLKTKEKRVRKQIAIKINEQTKFEMTNCEGSRARYMCCIKNRKKEREKHKLWKKEAGEERRQQNFLNGRN